MGTSRQCTGGSQGSAADAWVVVDSATAPPSDRAEEVSRAPNSTEHAAACSELDLCFMCDCTGSMSSYIRAAQQNIEEIARRIMTGHQADVRFALVSYRDHPPQEATYVTQVFPFTGDVAEMNRYVNTMSAHGGGDGPEAVTAALSDALHLPWRPNAAKVAVLIADAPPHGLEPTGDGFPDGDPDGRDPLDLARRMAALGITCYSVGVEPLLGQYAFARDFMCTLAEITGGQAIALSSASMLADVIINGSAEEISMAALQRRVEDEILHVRQDAERSSESLTDEECARRACSRMQQAGVTSMQMHTDGAMANQNASIWHSPAAAPPQTLAGAKSLLCERGVSSASSVSSPAPPMPMAASLPPGMVGLPSPFGAPPMPMAASPPPCMVVGPSPLGLPAAPMASLPPPAPPAWGGSMAAPGMAQQSVTRNALSEGLISADQVSRMMQRQQAQGRAS